MPIGCCQHCGATWEGSEESTNEPVYGYGVLCPACWRGERASREGQSRALTLSEAVDLHRFALLDKTKTVS